MQIVHEPPKSIFRKKKKKKKKKKKDKQEKYLKVLSAVCSPACSALR